LSSFGELLRANAIEAIRPKRRRSQVSGVSVDNATWASGGFQAAGQKLGLSSDSPVFGLLEFARLTLNSNNLTAIGMSITRWAGGATNTVSRGDTDLTGATLIASYYDGHGNTINVWQVDWGRSFWDDPHVRDIQLSFTFVSRGNGVMAEMYALYLSQIGAEKK
jgi:hypothetical protein